jgi:hypothetical protein
MTPISRSSPAGLVRILFLAANPSSTPPLRLDQEIRAIDQALRQASYRDQFDLQQHWAVRASDLQAVLLRHQPQIVHFSGAGGDAGQLVLEDDYGAAQPVSTGALGRLFEILAGDVRCVLLNACFSLPQAQAIAGHVDCVIGVAAEIGDAAAGRFSAAFYQALAYGRDVQAAFELGCNQIDLASLSGEKPALLALRRPASQVVFASAMQPAGDSAAPGPLSVSEQRHLEVQRAELSARYEALSRRIGALETDIGRALDLERKLILQERRHELVTERQQVLGELAVIERRLGM